MGRHRLGTMLAALVLLLPGAAAALEFPQFAHCAVVSGGDGAFAYDRFENAALGLRFQSAPVAGVSLGRRSALSGYLVKTARDAPWRLWLVHNDWDHYQLLPPLAELVIGDAKVRRENGVLAIRRRSKGDYAIFELDPAELIARASGTTHIDYAFHLRDKDHKVKRRAYYAARLDLSLLKARLEWLSGADASSAACQPTTNIVAEVVNPAAYTQCRADSAEGEFVSAWWNGAGARLMWQRKLTPTAYLKADRGFTSEQLEAAARSGKFIGDALPVALFPDWYVLTRGRGLKIADQSRLSVRLTMSGETIVLPARDANNGFSSEITERFLRGPEAVTLEILSPLGRVLDSAQVPAGTIAAANGKLQLALRQLELMLRDPMTNCHPPEEIIVT